MSYAITANGPSRLCIRGWGSKGQGEWRHPAQSPVAASEFRLEGELWAIAFDDRACRLRDSKGMRYIAHLLARPGVDVHALELLAAGERQLTAARRIQVEAEDLAGPGLGDTGEILDGRARAAYRERLDDLSQELEQAEAFADPERADRARREMEFLASELHAAIGLGGRARRGASGAERARQSVTKAVKSARERIAEHNDALGDHLAGALQTGTYCAYVPRAATDWRL